MKIIYNLSGAGRKKLVSAISQKLNTPIKYLGAPTFAYEVGDYTIDKVGTLIGPDDPRLVADLCKLHSFQAFSEEYETPAPKAADSFDEPCEPESNDNSDTLTIEMPLEGFTDTAIANLEKIIAGKSSLIQSAIGTDALPIEQTETTLRFSWFRPDSSPEEIDAYTRFICALCVAAKTLKRVNAKEKPVENEKFAFRVFLVRLGFLGDEFKSARRVLLKNLSGNSAFKSGKRNSKPLETAD